MPRVPRREIQRIQERGTLFRGRTLYRPAEVHNIKFLRRERGTLLPVPCRLITKEYTMNRKSLKAFFPGFAALVAAMGLLLAACRLPSSGPSPVAGTTGAAGPIPEGSGRLSLSLELSGSPGAGRNAAAPAARTAFPASIEIDHYVLSFEPRDGGAKAHDSVTVAGGAVGIADPAASASV
ncbi:MAG: hypothetical protein LBT95_00555, partial [Treponema sp.]|nr:hypothetical protein [Treponema sp.]